MWQFLFAQGRARGRAGEKVRGAAGVQESVGVLGSSIFSTTSIRRYLLWPMRRQYARYFAIFARREKKAVREFAEAH